jgi:hypothetical protein
MLLIIEEIQVCTWITYSNYLALHLAIAALNSKKAKTNEIIKALVNVKGIKLDIKNCNSETAKQAAKKCNISLKKL